MYRSIMVPVDLAHLPQIAGAIDVAGDLARHYGATLIFVSITAETPTSIAHTPSEFQEKLSAFAEEQAARMGISAAAKSYASTDPSIDIDEKLVHAIHDTGADLVVMASHKPGLVDYFWAAHGAHLAAHTDTSVFLVR
ncbi:MAG: universal stress protein family protein [Rhodobacteraceae bacterium HLUCCA12]|nr:MAG: universal stress protein family protein [Rhodobacteraceae bacterium HLUCCA12]